MSLSLKLSCLNQGVQSSTVTVIPRHPTIPSERAVSSRRDAAPNLDNQSII
jgi:hypothetical protein